MKRIKAINRIKSVLVDEQRSNKWLAEKIGVTPGTVSKWCVNRMQPSLQVLRHIAETLNVDIRELLVSTKRNN